uniref:Uncharacterized protein n=1 Tax=Aegilops tauschii subsp. strangulata TaxID=200361 RepID=A0A453CDV1_AEGTS
RVGKVRDHEEFTLLLLARTRRIDTMANLIVLIGAVASCRWLAEQKKMANVTPDSPVYLSLRMDGRVRGSGVGYPPWQAFVAQLPQVKGMWSGLFDGMDGRV